MYFSFFSCTHSMWKFLGQRANLSCFCDLCHSHGNAVSLSHCAGLGIEQQHHREEPDHSPTLPQWDLPFLLLTYKCSSYILNTSPLSEIWFTNIFFYSVECHLNTFLMVSFVFPFFFFLFFFFFFFGHIRYLEIPRSGIESKLQLRPLPQLWQC